MKNYKYKLSGKSIAQLRKKAKFYSDWSVGQKFEKETTKPITVIVPKDFYIKDSFSKTYQEQEEMVKKNKGVLLKANQMLELIWLHYKKTGKWITGVKNEYDWVRTSSLTDGGNRVYVQGSSDDGLVVNFWNDVADVIIGVSASSEIRPLKPRKFAPLEEKKQTKRKEAQIIELHIYVHQFPKGSAGGGGNLA